MKNLKKIRKQIQVKTFFDDSFIWYTKHAGLHESVKISRLKDVSGTAVNEFVVTNPDGSVLFNIDGLQARLKGTLEPHLNKMFSKQLKAFSIPKNEHIFIEVSPVILKDVEDIVYIMFYVQKLEDVRSHICKPLHQTCIH